MRHFAKLCELTCEHETFANKQFSPKKKKKKKKKINQKKKKKKKKKISPSVFLCNLLEVANLQSSQSGFWVIY